jgi:hypothetical protein
VAAQERAHLAGQVVAFTAVSLPRGRYPLSTSRGSLSTRWG